MITVTGLHDHNKFSFVQVWFFIFSTKRSPYATLLLYSLESSIFTWSKAVVTFVNEMLFDCQLHPCVNMVAQRFTHDSHSTSVVMLMSVKVNTRFAKRRWTQLSRRQSSICKIINRNCFFLLSSGFKDVSFLILPSDRLLSSLCCWWSYFRRASEMQLSGIRKLQLPFVCVTYACAALISE